MWRAVVSSHLVASCRALCLARAGAAETGVFVGVSEANETSVANRAAYGGVLVWWLVTREQ